MRDRTPQRRQLDATIGAYRDGIRHFAARCETRILAAARERTLAGASELVEALQAMRQTDSPAENRQPPAEPR